MTITKCTKEVRELTIDEFNKLMKDEKGWYLITLKTNPTTKIIAGFAPDYFNKN